MAEPAGYGDDVEAASDQCSCVRMAERVEGDVADPELCGQPLPFLRQLVGVADLAVFRSEYESVGRHLAETERDPKLKLGLPVLAQHLDGAGGEGDRPAAMPRFRRLEAEATGLSLLRPRG